MFSGYFKNRKEKRESRREAAIQRIAFRPLYDRGGAVGIYSGPSGPIVTIARIMDNVRHGRPAGHGIPPNALNDPNSP
jgi:hypothetical protein